jgi:hypothetical protein
LIRTRKQTPTPIPTGAPLLGDANGDGSVGADDALLILRYSLDIIGSDGLVLENCDMNSDGEIDASDALLLLRLVMQIG